MSKDASPSIASLLMKPRSELLTVVAVPLNLVSVQYCIVNLIFCLQYKLCKVKRVQVGPRGIPFLVTHDGRTIRYPDPVIKVNDTIQLDIASGKIMDSISFDSGEYLLLLWCIPKIS